MGQFIGRYFTFYKYWYQLNKISVGIHNVLLLLLKILFYNFIPYNSSMIVNQKMQYEKNFSIDQLRNN